MPRTVIAAFDELLKRVALTPDQQSIGSARQTKLRDFIKDRFTLYAAEPDPNPWLIGSYSRQTILRQERDIDIMVSLSPAKYWETYKSNSSGLVYLVRNALNKEYAKSEVTSSGAAVVMEMTVFNVDVVPVFPRDGGGYLVANGHNTWKATNPNVHFKLVEDHNKQDDRLKPLIKVMKFWNVCNGSLLESFHLEVMVEQMWRGVSIGSPAHGAKETLRVLTGQLPNAFNDPWSSGGRIDSYLSAADRAKVLGHAQKDAASAAKAEELRNQGNDSAAFNYWQAVFAKQFPAYG
jgi:Second Messenger Oligonucleotide or Dinucleotide Synthetase domain